MAARPAACASLLIVVLGILAAVALRRLLGRVISTVTSRDRSAIGRGLGRRAASLATTAGGAGRAAPPAGPHDGVAAAQHRDLRRRGDHGAHGDGAGRSRSSRRCSPRRGRWRRARLRRAEPRQGLPLRHLHDHRGPVRRRRHRRLRRGRRHRRGGLAAGHPPARLRRRRLVRPQRRDRPDRQPLPGLRRRVDRHARLVPQRHERGPLGAAAGLRGLRRRRGVEGQAHRAPDRPRRRLDHRPDGHRQDPRQVPRRRAVRRPARAAGPDQGRVRPARHPAPPLPPFSTGAHS